MLCGLVAFSDEKTKQPVEDFNKEDAFILEKLDSLTNWLFEANIDRSGVDTIIMEDSLASYPVFPDSVIIRNMLTITSEIPLAFNDRVRRYIEVYSMDHRERVGEMLGLSQLYFPIFEEELDRRNMPHQLKYLPVVESALNPNAVSRAGATGLWQVMYSTGRMLGMEINSYIDERRDPYRATQAALDYLQRLHAVYGDWLLVIAAYNCGPGNLNKAIARSGGKRTYWEIFNYLPRETRGYVPAFMGAMYVMIHHEDFGIPMINPKFSFNATDTVVVNKQVSLAQISEQLAIDKNELIFLNPALKKKIIPVSKTGYALKLPIQKVAVFEANRDSLFKHAANAEDDLIAQSQIASWQSPSATSYNHKNMSKMTYKVKTGDNLGYIAEWYDCRAQEIRNWNGIYGSTIRVGQRLVIYVPKDKEHLYANIDDLSFHQKQKKEGVTTSSETTARDDNCNCVYYKVRPGDTLWDISKKYRVSIDEIKKSNNISNGRSIKPGMVLKIMLT